MGDILQLIALGAIWGSSFLFLRISVGDIGPVPLMFIRLALGSLVLLPFLLRDRAHFTLKRWPLLAFIGLINSALPFLLFAWGAERAPAGIGAIANGMTALCAALVGYLFFGERLTTRQSLALGIGFIGIAVLASGKMEGMSVGWASLAGALASVMYGFGVHLAKRHLGGLPVAALAAVTLGSGALVMLPLAVLTWPTQAVPAGSWLCAAVLGVLCTGIAFAMFYRLIGRIGAMRSSTVTYLVPPFGVAWAWLFIDEPATPTMLVACALILGGVAWAQKRI